MSTFHWVTLYIHCINKSKMLIHFFQSMFKNYKYYEYNIIVSFLTIKKKKKYDKTMTLSVENQYRESVYFNDICFNVKVIESQHFKIFNRFIFFLLFLSIDIIQIIKWLCLFTSPYIILCEYQINFIVNDLEKIKLRLFQEFAGIL